MDGGKQGRACEILLRTTSCEGVLRKSRASGSATDGSMPLVMPVGVPRLVIPRVYVSEACQPEGKRLPPDGVLAGVHPRKDASESLMCMR